MNVLKQPGVIESMQLLETGECSSRELTQLALSRIEAVEEKIHAFITLEVESALRQADLADQKRRDLKKDSLEPLPLLGLPIAVKDILCVEGMRCTCGSRILENFYPAYTATSIHNLQQAGVVILGKTNTDEFAMGSSTENSAYGVTHNPWDLTRVPGGTSGGSAAVVSAGMAPAAIGTDTGGSVRQPASFCGITGIKPTYGRVSRYGLVAFGSSLDSVGVLALSSMDAALIFQHMAGYDPKDATSMDLPVPLDYGSVNSDLRGFRIGVPKEYFIPGVQAEVTQAALATIEQFKNLGAEIQEISLPYTEYALPVYYLIAPAEASANLARYDGVRYGLRLEGDNLLDMYHKTRGAGFGAEVKRRIMLGTYALSAGYYDAYYGQAQKVRTLIKRDFDLAFEKVDAIISPVAPTTAFRIGEHTDDPLAMYLEDIFSLPANLAGVPGIAFPAGFDRDNLPIGMQLMGRPFQEERLFRMASAFQLVTDWHKKTPVL